MTEDFFKEADAYHRSLGNMFDAFAKAERELVHLLGKLVGLDHDMTNALLSGARADAAIGQIRRVHRALKKELPSALDFSLIQLKIISNDRNLLAHHGAISSNRHGRVTSNWRVALPDVTMNEISVSPEQLDSMAQDLRTTVLVFDYLARQGSPTGTEEFDQICGIALAEAEQNAWRYKSTKVDQTLDQ